MIIKRIKYSVVFIVMFFSLANLAYAEIIFNEIAWMGTSDSSSNEWIELYNNGVDSVSLVGWVIETEDQGISTALSGSIGPKSFYLMERTDDSTVPNITANKIFTGALSNGGETLILKNDSNSNIQTLDFSSKWPDGYNGDYKTMQWDGSKWIYADSTPKATNSGVSNNSSSDNSLDNNTDNPADETVDPIPVNNKTPVIYKITTKIIASKIVTAGVPFNIDHTTTGLNKEKIILGKFVWNFGDGMQKQLSLSDPFSYVYDYSGEYVLTLSYSDSIFDINPDATDRLTIKVIPSGVSISSVGTYADPFVEIENNSSYEMSLNKWILKGSVHSFLIPEGMVILPNKKLKFSPKITGFDFNDLSFISIIDTSGQVFATYPKQKTYSTKNYSASNSQGNIVKADIVASDQVAGIANSPDIINLNDLGASAGSADNGLNNKILIYLGLAGIIAIGLLSIFLIRRKSEIPDYVEKGISASDMTIIE